MRQKTRVPTLVVTLGLAAVLVAACSGSGSTAAGTTSGATPPVTTTGTSAAAATTRPAAAGTGACKYVTTAQASALAKSPVKAGVSRSLATGSVPFEYCDYIFDPGNAPGVSVAVADLGSNGIALFAQFRASKQSESDYQVVTGVGDEAFFSGENLNVRKGNTGLILYVGRSTGYPRGPDGLPDEKSLAALVLGQL